MRILLLGLLMVPTPHLMGNPIAADTIRIGVIVAQTGKASDYGLAAIKGARLAVDEINTGGGVLDRRLELVIFDDRSAALGARQAALRAVEQKVTAVVGAVWSTHSMAVAPVLQANQIPMISPGSTAPGVTRLGNYIFRTSYTDEFQGEMMAEFAYHAMGFRKAAVLVNISETYCQVLAQYFTTYFKSQGGEIVLQAEYKGSDSDFRRILEPLKHHHPELVFLPGYTRDSGLIMKQARNMAINTTFMGGDAWETAIADYAREALEGSYFSTFWHPNVPFRQSRQFIERYRAAHGNEEISSYAPLAYDAVSLLADAIRRANSLAPEAIREALADTREFAGATGSFTFNADGDPVSKGASILQFNKGRWVFYRAFAPR